MVVARQPPLAHRPAMCPKRSTTTKICRS